MLTDVRLEVVNEVFHTHKVVLAAASPYFKGWLLSNFVNCLQTDFSVLLYHTAMFTSGLREKDASVVKLQGVCPTVMSKLLSFIYTGEIVINKLVVCQLLPAASMLQVCCRKVIPSVLAANFMNLFPSLFVLLLGGSCYSGMLYLS